MKTYAEIVEGYRKRRHDTVVDTIAVGLTYMDELAVESGLLEETDILSELGDAACTALPFAVVAVTEGSKMILGKKPVATSLRDGAYRMAKSGVAMGVGSAVTSAAGFWAAIPVTMGVRALFDRYRSRALTGHRVQGRITRLRELNEAMRRKNGDALPEGAVQHLANETVSGM